MTIKMISTKRINDFIIVTIVIVIIVENSNANNCIRQMNEVGINDTYDASSAFVYIYNRLNWSATCGIENVIVRYYLQDLFDKATFELSDNIINNPKTWCSDPYNIAKNMKSFIKNKTDCTSVLNKAGYNIEGNAKEALSNGFFNLTDGRRIGAAAIDYYGYLINAFQPYIKNSHAVGPRKFCDSFGKNIHLPRTRKNRGGQTSTANANPLGVDLNQPDFSGTNLPEEYYDPYQHYEVPSESTFTAGEFNPYAQNQTGLDLNEPSNESTGLLELFPNDVHFASSSYSTYVPDENYVLDLNSNPEDDVNRQ